ncbi:MAG: ribbon-helix-helix domain-containing protein [Acetobacteraceae bacterium]
MPQRAHAAVLGTTGGGFIGLVKRSFSLSGHRTSVALEQEFWSALDALATERGQSLSALVADRDAVRDNRQPLASALRVFALRASAPRALDSGDAERNRMRLGRQSETSQEQEA